MRRDDAFPSLASHYSVGDTHRPSSALAIQASLWSPYMLGLSSVRAFTPTILGLGCSCPVLHTLLQGHLPRHFTQWKGYIPHSPSLSVTSLLSHLSYLNYLSICFWFASPFLKRKSPSSRTGMSFTPVLSTGVGGQTTDILVDVQWKVAQRKEWVNAHDLWRPSHGNTCAGSGPMWHEDKLAKSWGAVYCVCINTDFFFHYPAVFFGGDFQVLGVDKTDEMCCYSVYTG